MKYTKVYDDCGLKIKTEYTNNSKLFNSSYLTYFFWKNIILFFPTRIDFFVGKISLTSR